MAPSAGLARSGWLAFVLLFAVFFTCTSGLAPLKSLSTCSYTKAQAGDGCWALASRCHISLDDLKRFNPTGDDSDFCNSIQVVQSICCSDGSPPDFSPQPNSDGSCYEYTIQAGDLCYKIALDHHMTAREIEDRNKDTWGWSGCDALMVGQTICLSSGDPPMPSPIANAVCGPQVPGTPKPHDGTKLSDLNPCPLNACCDIWGQCGITPVFCTPSPGDTGAPGTAKSGQNGCISHCGTEVTNNDKGPSAFMHVGYFEAWNGDRECLQMVPADISTEVYTHVHFAFGNITHEFQVDLGAYAAVFESFLGIKPKRILSFGGWSFSTSSDTYPIFRSGVSDSDRSRFASNVVKFAVYKGLDGLDFDWEYPGASDIPGVSPGSPEDGKNYLAFLKEVRTALPADKSLSIAAPASYWYLRGFPIREISDIVDYIVFMTYDLHGQWDYNNKFVNEGCPNGNCLRSHVNMTETMYALAMITKAGVPANKVVIGMAKYGRSFNMTDPRCHTVECTFTGPESGATPGRCTNTAGYISNYEIHEIISDHNVDPTGNESVQQYFDEGDTFVYDTNQWVSYLSDETYKSRVGVFQTQNFRGVSDWAIDLDKDYSSGNADDGNDSEGGVVQPCDFKLKFDSLKDLDAMASKLSLYCVRIYTVHALSAELAAAIANYTDVNNGYDALYDYYVRYERDLINPTIEKFLGSDKSKWSKELFECTLEVDGHNSSALPCPLGGPAADSYSVYWTLKDPERFFHILEADYGIERSWVKFGVKYLPHPPCPSQPCMSGYHAWIGYPMQADNVTIPNPKDIISKAPGGIMSLQNMVDATYCDMVMGYWIGSVADVARTVGMPVALVEQAVDSMAKVKKIGQTVKDMEKKQLIIEIVTAVLVVVPFVGEMSATAAGMASLARAIAMFSEVSNAALSIYEIVEDPKSAPMAVMGMVLGVAALPRTGTTFSKTGKIMRDMKPVEVEKMGEIFVAKNVIIKRILRECA